MLRKKGKSRRDDTLLTVDFNLRKQNGKAKSRRDDTCIAFVSDRKVSSHTGLRRAYEAFPVRRLKSTVNRVSSLRDISSPAPYFHKLFISYS